jgi:hypothetical protein
MKLKSISRIDTHNTHGWYVRVKFQGHEHRKLFSDNRYGNKLSSLVAAKKYRDELEASLGKPRTDRLVISAHKRNRSGMIGVRRREFPAFEVQASIKPGKIKKVIIPIINGDEQAAFQKACLVRQQLLQKLYLDEDKIDF